MPEIGIYYIIYIHIFICVYKLHSDIITQDQPMTKITILLGSDILLGSGRPTCHLALPHVKSISRQETYNHILPYITSHFQKTSLAWFQQYLHHNAWNFFSQDIVNVNTKVQLKTQHMPECSPQSKCADPCWQPNVCSSKYSTMSLDPLLFESHTCSGDYWTFVCPFPSMSWTVHLLNNTSLRLIPPPISICCHPCYWNTYLAGSNSICNEGFFRLSHRPVVRHENNVFFTSFKESSKVLHIGQGSLIMGEWCGWPHFMQIYKCNEVGSKFMYP